ncbi:MAG TPA: c-type cytochrome [Candidatus Binatia bacterium]|jgi:cytochrome c|nr:c-type cytochrome [Candidatus Binatia bacterium]
MRAHLRSTAPVCALAVGAVLVAARAADAFTQAQVMHGAWVLRRQCARCHGPNAEGKADAWRGLTAPELVGPNALPPEPRPYQQIRRQRFETAADVFDFVSAAMPADQPASLEPGEYWDVIARLLDANGVAPNGTALDAASAPGVALPRRGGLSGDEKARP